MRKIAIFFALALSTPAWALNTDQLLATIAMPLAVNAVSRVPGVSETQLADLVTTLNQANVQPAQFVEVIRYVPVAVNQQELVQFVQRQSSQGVTGDALVKAIVGRLRTHYNVTPALAPSGDPTTDPLAVIALPLAVAAVSDLTGVSQDELASFVATLNTANVPPTQIVEVLRYVPVALTTDNGPQFVEFVQHQTTQGVTGPALVPVVVQQLQTFYPAQTRIVVSEPARVTRLRPVPQIVVVDQDFVPAIVVARMKEHPHGGPPGQIKKELGLQTGAEVVHGERRERRIVVAPQTQAQAPADVYVPKRENEHGLEVRTPQAPMISSAPPPKGKDHGDHGEHGKGGGKGKGHGKD